MFMRFIVMGCFILCSTVLAGSVKKPVSQNPHVLIKTSMGDIEVELYPDKAPVSVGNFLEYVNAKFYDKTIFHRVINGFMIQGGGFTANMAEKQTRKPISYEITGLSNVRGTISYARTNDPNSATSQFFINHRDNFNLDHGKTRDGYGYAVFGKVVSGMSVVDQIAGVQTGMNPNGMSDVPVKPVVILSIRVVGQQTK
jgi:peptidyl-prolyl cis-trans isomerase A (cyclophilin A)